MSDDDDSDKEGEQDERDVIERELFEGEEGGEPMEQEERTELPDTLQQDLVAGSGDESGELKHHDNCN